MHLGRARWYSPRVLGRKARDPRGSIGQDWNCWSNRSLLANSSAGCLRHNLAELARWVDNREGRHDWDLYAAYALTCEGIPQPTAAQVADRLALTRAKMTRLMPADAGREQPLGESAPPRYAHVYSGFCADSATGDKQTWRRFMRNIAALVAEGGTFWTAALRRATSYRAGRHRFPSANLDSAACKRSSLSTSCHRASRSKSARCRRCASTATPESSWPEPASSGGADRDFSSRCGWGTAAISRTPGRGGDVS